MSVINCNGCLQRTTIYYDCIYIDYFVQNGSHVVCLDEIPKNIKTWK